MTCIYIMATISCKIFQNNKQFGELSAHSLKLQRNVSQRNITGTTIKSKVSSKTDYIARLGLKTIEIELDE